MKKDANKKKHRLAAEQAQQKPATDVSATELAPKTEEVKSLTEEELAAKAQEQALAQKQAEEKRRQAELKKQQEAKKSSRLKL